MSDATKGDNRPADMLCGDVIVALEFIRRLANHFEYQACETASSREGRDIAILEAGFAALGALAEKAGVTLDTLDAAVDWRDAEKGGVDDGSHQKPVRSCPHRAEGARTS